MIAKVKVIAHGVRHFFILSHQNACYGCENAENQTFIWRKNAVCKRDWHDVKHQVLKCTRTNNLYWYYSKPLIWLTNVKLMFPNVLYLSRNWIQTDFQEEQRWDFLETGHIFTDNHNMEYILSRCCLQLSVIETDAAFLGHYITYKLTPIPCTRTISNLLISKDVSVVHEGNHGFECGKNRSCTKLRIALPVSIIGPLNTLFPLLNITEIFGISELIGHVKMERIEKGEFKRLSTTAVWFN